MSDEDKIRKATDLLNLYMISDDIPLLKKFDNEYFWIKTVQHFNDRLVLQKKKGKCNYPGCEKDSIPNSHTIQKEGPLRAISKDGRLFHIEYSLSEQKVIFKEIGINKASGFPGFCEEHEKIFNDFEQKLNYKSNSIILQSFRTICRDITNYKLTIENNIAQVNRYKNEQIHEHNNILHKEMNNEKIELTDYEDPITHQYDLLQNKCNDTLRKLNKCYYEFEKILKNQESNLICINIETDFSIPIALTGIDFIRYKYVNSDIINEAIIIYTVSTFNNSMIITITGTKNDEKILKQFVKTKLNCPLNILSTIESWMVYGTDNWYISKNFFMNINEKVKRRILLEFTNINKNSVCDLSFSIFSDERRRIINEMNKEKLSNPYIVNLIKREEEKFNVTRDLE